MTLSASGKLLIGIALFLVFCLNLVAQKSEKEVHQLDFFDLLKSKERRSAEENDSIKVVPDKLYFTILPFIGYNPAMGFTVGFTMNPAIYFGTIKDTPISAFAISMTATTKRQVLINVRSNIFTNKAKYILQGDWRLYFYSQPTYGLGSDIVGIDTSGFIIHTGDVGYSVNNVADPMMFNYIRIHETLNRRIVGKFYVGGGYHLDYHFNIRDGNLDLTKNPAVLTPHYAYSMRNGFNPQQYIQSGLVLSLLYDTRDNSIRPTKGIYAKLIPRFNFTWLGSDIGSTTLYSEFSTYIGLSSKNPAHLLAFWYQGCFVLDGKVPYLDLPAVGWDTYNRSGRGYVQGRIRGVNMVYGEVEYRFPISRYTRILGGVLFVNATTCDYPQDDLHLFEYLAPGGGAGLRVMFNKKTKANLCIDLGFGVNGSCGVFLNLTETF